MTAILAAIMTLTKPTDNAAAAAILADAQFLATETGGSTGDTWRWLLMAAANAMVDDLCRTEAVDAVNRLRQFASAEHAFPLSGDKDGVWCAAQYFRDVANEWAQDAQGGE